MKNFSLAYSFVFVLLFLCGFTFQPLLAGYTAFSVKLSGMSSVSLNRLGKSQSELAEDNVWTNIGPYGSHVNKLAVDPLNTNIIYAASDTGTNHGLYKSTNGGASWSRINGHPNIPAFRTLAINPANTSVLYAGSEFGVYKSTDGGGNWNPTNNGLVKPRVLELILNPTNPAVIYVRVNGGTDPDDIYKSIDNGANWIRSSNGLPISSLTSLTINPSDPLVLYVGTHGRGIYKSTNAGATWSLDGLDSNSVSALALSSSNPSVHYALLSGSQSGASDSVYKSIDGGINWNLASNGLPTPFYGTTLMLSPTNANLLYVGTNNGIYKSIDGGTTWNLVSSGIPTSSYVSAFAFNPVNPTVLYAALYSYGVYKSTDGGSNWGSIGHGLTDFDHPVTSLALTPTNPMTLYFGTARGIIYKSLNNGASWAQSVLGSSTVGALAIDPQNLNTIYAGTYANGLFKSINSGVEWAPFNIGLPLPLSASNFFTLVIDPNTLNTIYAGANGTGVFKSTNGGANWTNIGNGLTNSYVSTLAIAAGNPSTIFVGTIASFQGVQFSGVFKSSNGGVNWSQTGLPFSYVSALVIDPSNTQTIYAGTSGGLFRSTNGGTSWSQMTPLSVLALAIAPSSPSTIYAGTSGSGVLKSLNGGVDWTSFNSGLTNLSIQALAISPSGQTIYAGTAGGVFSYTYANTALLAHAGNDQTVRLPTTVTLDGSRSTSTLSYSWSFIAKPPSSAAMLNNANSVAPTFTPDKAGLYRIKLVVTVDANSAEDTVDVQVLEPACTLTCNAIVPATALINASVQFTPTTVLANCNAQLTYEWSFGDNTANSTLPNPKHTYTNAGSYGWKLTVRGPESTVCMKTGTIVVEVNCAVPTITKQPDSKPIPSGGTLTMSVTASGTGLTFQWYEGSKGDTSKPQNNGTTASFTTPALTSSKSYWVRVSNACGRADSNSGKADILPPTNLIIEAADPMCGEVVTSNFDNLYSCAGVFLKATATGEVFVDTDINRLARARVFRSAVVTDGVTLLLLRVRSDSPVTFRLEGSPTAGVLLTRQGVLKGNEVAAPSEGKMAYAVYRAPLDYPDSDPQARITATNSVGGGRLELELRRPPVVLVHGVWSGSDTWGEMVPFLKKSFDLAEKYLPNYPTNTTVGSFDPTGSDRKAIDALRLAILDTLREVRSGSITDDKGTKKKAAAITQVDVVGHSMGGLVSRAFAASKSPFEPFKRLENYNRGDFHKLVTIGTPHQGSPLADWLIEHKCDILTLGRNKTIEQKFAEGIYISDPMPIGPAIYEFQSASEAIKKIGATAIPSHAIVGVAPDDSFAGLEFKLTRILKNSGNNSPKYDSNGNTSVDGLLGGNGNHDAIVPVDSQRGGLGESATSSRTDTTHLDETSSETIWERVAELLQSLLTDTSTFGNFTALTPNPTPTPRPRYNCPTSSLAELSAEVASRTAVVTLSPPVGTIVRPGDVVQIGLSISGGNPIEGVFFALPNSSPVLEGNGPFTFSYVVPSNRAGKINILADTNGPGPENYSASTSLLVAPNVGLNSISASLNYLAFEKAGQVRSLRINGLFVDGTQLDLTSSTAGTIYAVQGGASNIVTVSPEGVIEARGNGQATVVVTNAGKTTTVKVYVSSTGVPGSVVVNVSAANYTNVVFAPEEIVSVFGTSLATATQAATTMPLPTSLAGTTVKVTDSTGTERLAPLFFVSPTQINYQIPPGTAPGAAMVRIDRPNDFPSLETLLIDATAPGLFTANASGNGVAAALALRVKSNGVQSYEPIARFDTTINRMVATPIDLGPADEQVFLILYGTGLKFRSSLAAVTAKIGGVDAPVSFAQAQGSLTGLDQVNALIPRNLLGRGEVDVVLTVDGKVANTVRIAVK